MTPHAAKKIIRTALAQQGLPPYKLSARTISFTDLARTSKVFVLIHGWPMTPNGYPLSKVAKENGFCLEFSAK